jgi:hypothetical protein
MKYNNQLSLLWTIDHCPIVIFFSYSIVEPFVLSFLVEQCQKKNSPSTTKAKQQTMRMKKLGKDLSSRSNDKVIE